jgi:hypothetical protein
VRAWPAFEKPPARLVDFYYEKYLKKIYQINRKKNKYMVK